MKASAQNILIMFLTSLFFLGFQCAASSSLSNYAPSITTSSSSGLPSPTMATGCESGAGDARMDTFTVKQLSKVFCTELSANFPSSQDGNFSIAVYPSNLTAQPGSPDYAAIEQEGYIGVFEFMLQSAYSYKNGTVQVDGGEEKDACAQDNCVDIFHEIITQCEWNSHYYGGVSMAFSDCGMYQVYSLSCMDNILSPECSRWHEEYQPSFTTKPSPNYTSIALYSYNATQASSTTNSYVLVSTMTGSDWTSVTPLMFTLATTYTGYEPNPTWDGPTFSPTSSSPTGSSSTTPTT